MQSLKHHKSHEFQPRMRCWFLLSSNVQSCSRKVFSASSAGNGSFHSSPCRHNDWSMVFSIIQLGFFWKHRTFCCRWFICVAELDFESKLICCWLPKNPKSFDTILNVKLMSSVFCCSRYDNGSLSSNSFLLDDYLRKMNCSEFSKFSSWSCASRGVPIQIEHRQPALQ